MATNNNEKTKRGTSGINLSEVEGSASYAIKNWWSTYDFMSASPAKIREDVYKIIPEKKKEEPKVIDLLRKLSKSKNSEMSAIMIGNFVLSGDGESVVRGTKEKDLKFIKNFGRK